MGAAKLSPALLLTCQNDSSTGWPGRMSASTWSRRWVSVTTPSRSKRNPAVNPSSGQARHVPNPHNS
eukprot:4832873-Pyramimonas_sp.AAC.1